MNECEFQICKEVISSRDAAVSLDLNSVRCVLEQGFFRPVSDRIINIDSTDHTPETVTRTSVHVDAV